MYKLIPLRLKRSNTDDNSHVAIEAIDDKASKLGLYKNFISMFAHAFFRLFRAYLYQYVKHQSFYSL